MSYLKRFGTRRVPQREPLPGQVANSAGGFAWAVDVWTRLRRFLVLGTEGGSYYATEHGADARERAGGRGCVREDGLRAVAEIVRVSAEGRAPKNDPALFALALAAGVGDDATRRAALDALPQVARTGTHLFQFAAFVEGFRGWGRGAAPGGRPLVRGAAGGRARLPGGQVPPARRLDATATCCAWPTRPAGSAPATRRSRSRTSTLACSSGSSAAARPTACRAWSRASSGRRRRRRRRRPRRSSASTACRARRSARAPDLARGVGGAARATCR